MGHLITRLLNSLSDLKAKILMLGLDNAGKTTILYQMKLNEVVASVPTVGFNVEEVNYKGLHFSVWDIGGQTKLRDLWHHYYSGSDAVIYVLDSSDEERLQLAKETLENVIDHPDMVNCPVLIFANKMDMASLRPVQLVEKMGLHKSKRAWHLQPCCGLNGDGIIEGFEWLRKELKNRK
jgi:small GTP-binding protein